jgi:hypothetical protein
MTLLFSYIQFAPIAYTFKLHIELTMAELISKIVHTANRGNFGTTIGNNATSNTNIAGQTITLTSTQQIRSYYSASDIESGKIHIITSDCKQYECDGIMKTVTMMSMNDTDDANRGSTPVQETAMS